MVRSSRPGSARSRGQRGGTRGQLNRTAGQEPADSGELSRPEMPGRGLRGLVDHGRESEKTCHSVASVTAVASQRRLVPPVSSAPASSCLPKLESSSSRLAWMAPLGPPLPGRPTAAAPVIGTDDHAPPAPTGSFGLTIPTNEVHRPPAVRTRHDQVFGRTALAMSTSSIRRLRSDVSRGQRPVSAFQAEAQ